MSTEAMNLNLSAAYMQNQISTLTCGWQWQLEQQKEPLGDMVLDHQGSGTHACKKIANYLSIMIG